jgi:hypothetical protein
LLAPGTSVAALHLNKASQPIKQATFNSDRVRLGTQQQAMPFILNGEVLRDDDPRAIARRQQQQQPQQSQSQQRGQANIQNLQGLGARRNGGGTTGGRPMVGGRTGGPGVAQQPAQAHHPDGVLAPVARMLGVEGKTVMIPMQVTQVIGLEGQQTMPYCHALLLGAFVMYMLFFRGGNSTRQEFTVPPNP